MNFTFEGYKSLLVLLKDNGYNVCSYHDWNEKDKCVILRHDVDFDLHKAVEMAEFENKHSVKSTYFVLISSDFYNAFSKDCSDCINSIMDYGHEIGLHFDEVRYPEASGNLDVISDLILEECYTLQKIVHKPISTVSMHRPSRFLLESDLIIPGVVNSYSKEFFNGFKYLSDSRRRWREEPERVITCNCFNRLHILTHSFWYNNQESDLRSSIFKYIADSKYKTYNNFNNNITNFESILLKKELC